MPGPVVTGVREKDSSGHPTQSPHNKNKVLTRMSEGAIKLILLNSGEVLIARMRKTTDFDGDSAYQLIRPCLVVTDFEENSVDSGLSWRLDSYMRGLTAQESIVLFKSALASILNPNDQLLRKYAEFTLQECPSEETPLERLKQAIDEYTQSLET